VLGRNKLVMLPWSRCRSQNANRMRRARIVRIAGLGNLLVVPMFEGWEQLMVDEWSDVVVEYCCIPDDEMKKGRRLR